MPSTDAQKPWWPHLKPEERDQLAAIDGTLGGLDDSALAQWAKRRKLIERARMRMKRAGEQT